MFFEDGKPTGKTEIAVQICVLTAFSRGAVEGLDAQMLFDPAKEQFDAPLEPYRVGEMVRAGSCKIVTQEKPELHELVLLIEVSDSSSRQGIVDSRIDSGEDDRSDRTAVRYSCRPAGSRRRRRLHILARPHDEEGGRQRDPCRVGPHVNVSAIHDHLKKPRTRV